MWWYFNVSCTTSYISSIWMFHSTGNYSMSYTFDWLVITKEHEIIYVAVHEGAWSVNCMLTVWIHPLPKMKWSFGNRMSEMIIIRMSEMIIMKTECLKWLLWWQSVIENYGNIYLLSSEEYLRSVFDTVQNLKPKFDVGILVLVGFTFK